MSTLTYEAFLDEVTTLLTELYDMEDSAAIKLVMDAQDAEYFVAHDDHAEMRRSRTGYRPSRSSSSGYGRSGAPERGAPDTVTGRPC
jgi:hypothetical protein